MFDGYTTEQLLELRSLCADIVAEEGAERSDALLILNYIDEEFRMREWGKAA
jgi:hypothetical protein